MKVSSVLTTDAWAFINIRSPVTSWAAYRGALVSPPTQPGFLSVWTTAMIQANRPQWVRRELELEHHRVNHYPNKVSRLRGIYCFTDLTSAEKALSWGTSQQSHFRPEFLVELSLVEIQAKTEGLDANWFSYACDPERQHLVTDDWTESYWIGRPFPHAEPIWEVLVEGRASLLGTGLREKAYSLIKSRWPETLCFLEIARQAMWIHSDLGNLCGWLRRVGEELAFDYCMDMRDADNPAFLSRLLELQKDPNLVNRADMEPFLATGTFGRVPDLRPLSFQRPFSALPWIDAPPIID
jgi:hypothetical protein